MEEKVIKAYECCTSEEYEQCESCPLFEFGETKLDCKTELLRKIKPNKVYELMVDWATNDDQGCTTELYATEENAIKAFNFEIIQAMQDYGCFDEETGELEEGWVLDKGNNFWELYEGGYYSTSHCTITITEKEIY